MRKITLLTGLLISLTGSVYAQGADPATAGAAPAQPQNNPAALSKLFDIIRAEPGIKEVHKRALEFYRLEPARINRLASNARLKGLLPDLTLSVNSSLGNTFSNMKDGVFQGLMSPDNPNGFKERTTGQNDEFGWSVQGRWQLDRLIFNSEALDAKSLITLEENLIREVTTMYYSRRRTLAGLILSPPETDEDYFYELMRLDELTTTIDSFTGGYFAKKSWDWEKELLGADKTKKK